MKTKYWPATIMLAMAVALAADAAIGQGFPSKSIRLVVGFPPGGSGDFIARNMAEEMNRLLDQQIIVDNRPGAGANIASEIVMRATPDGHTILLGGSFSHAVNATLYKKLPFDVEKDFAPISKVANFTTIIAVNPKLPVNTLKELIAKAKAEPGKLTYSSPGAGTPSHMAGAVFNIAAGRHQHSVRHYAQGVRQPTDPRAPGARGAGDRDLGFAAGIRGVHPSGDSVLGQGGQGFRGDDRLRAGVRPG